MSKLKVNEIDSKTGTTITVTTTKTLSVPAGATLDVAGTQTVSGTVNLASSTLTLPATLPATAGTNITQLPGANITGTIPAAALGNAGITWQAVQTAAFTAVAGKGYPVNTTASAFTVTLPSSASVGDQVALVDYAGTFDTNAVTLNSNGLKLKGSTNDRNLLTTRLGVYLTYVDATQGWIATSGVNTATTALSPVEYSMDFLVIGGGGGGGAGQMWNQTGGGGGAGGYRTSTQTSIIGNVITITVGDGATGTSTDATPAVNGSPSSIVATGLTTISSAGGGGGGMYNSLAGGSGGSGGGGGSTAGSGGAGNTPSTSPVQGYDGGNGATAGGSANSGGGGGGSSAIGTNASGTNAGDGGAGTASSITGAAVTRAGGGGGGAQGSGASAGVAGSGGAGIGGLGQQAGANGTANTGSGAGGGANDAGGSTATTKGGNGGKGVVIISMPTSGYSGTITGAPTVTTSGVNTILTFTGTGSYTE